jgi:hypothetical protein
MARRHTRAGLVVQHLRIDADAGLPSGQLRCSIRVSLHTRCPLCGRRTGARVRGARGARDSDRGIVLAGEVRAAGVKYWSVTYIRNVVDPATLTPYLQETRSYWHVFNGDRVVVTYTYPDSCPARSRRERCFAGSAARSPGSHARVVPRALRRSFQASLQPGWAGSLRCSGLRLPGRRSLRSNGVAAWLGHGVAAARPTDAAYILYPVPCPIGMLPWGQDDLFIYQID